MFGTLTCLTVEKLGYLDFGVAIPAEAEQVIREDLENRQSRMDKKEKWRLAMQGLSGLVLVICLIAHVADVYLVGLILSILAAAFSGASKHQLNEALKESGEFVFLLAIFFGIVAMIHQTHLFEPVSAWIFGFEGKARILALFAATGVLSAISDNVFVASIFITTVEEMNLTREEFENLAVAVNMGTNIPSIATPNGQAAFLFLLMSPVAALVKMSYVRMLLLAFPFAVTCTAAGAVAIWFLD